MQITSQEWQILLQRRHTLLADVFRIAAKGDLYTVT